MDSFHIFIALLRSGDDMSLKFLQLFYFSEFFYIIIFRLLLLNIYFLQYFYRILDCGSKNEKKLEKKTKISYLKFIILKITILMFT